MKCHRMLFRYLLLFLCLQGHMYSIPMPCELYRSVKSLHHAIAQKISFYFPTITDQTATAQKEKKQEKIVVFMHGTKFFENLSYNLFSLLGTTNEDEDIEHFEKIDLEVLPDPAKDITNFASHHIVRAYDTVAHECREGEERTYYRFSWSGKLNQHERRRAAKYLYRELCDIRNMHPQGTPLELVAYSYGGRVALNLAEIEDEKKKGLVINRLAMVAAPLQKDTESLVVHPMFRRIYQLFSAGDRVQLLDYFSSWLKNYQTFDDFLKLEKKDEQCPTISNIRLIVNGDEKHYDHEALWKFASEKIRPMWLMPYPPVVLLPLVMEAIDGVRHESQVREHKIAPMLNFDLTLDEETEGFVLKTISRHEELSIDVLSERMGGDFAMQALQGAQLVPITTQIFSALQSSLVASHDFALSYVLALSKCPVGV